MYHIPLLYVIGGMAGLLVLAMVIGVLSGVADMVDEMERERKERDR